MLKAMISCFALLWVTSAHSQQDVTYAISKEEQALLWNCQFQARAHSFERKFRTGMVDLVNPIVTSKTSMFFGNEQEVWIYKREHLDKDLTFVDGKFYETGTTTKRVTYVVSSMPWSQLLLVNDGNGRDPVPKANKKQNFSCTWNAVTFQMEWGYYTANIRKETFFPKLR